MGARGDIGTYVLNIPKMKTSFYGSRSVQIKSIKDWYNIIDKIHFTTEDFMKRSEVIKKIKKAVARAPVPATKILKFAVPVVFKI